MSLNLTTNGGMNTLKISGKTQILGVIGDPVTHSLSPVMHNAALAEMGMDYVYIPLPIAIENLGMATAGLMAIDAVKGFNLTIPHKQEIIPLLAQVSEIAQTVGAVNTVKRVGDNLVGTNTDVEGFLVPLRKLARNWQNTPVLILGSGGAARAVVVACIELGCQVVHVVGRDKVKMKRFQAQMTQQIGSYSLRVHTWASLDNLLEVAGLVVNATPIGMSNESESPLRKEQLQLLPDNAIAYDLIYTPRPTKFLRLAGERNLVTIDGLEMLLHQGALALEYWLDRPAPVEVMWQALLTHLAQ
jgi:shikimate dehydrogenase